jgi:lipopolysaccharide biosynthesis protein
MELNPINKNNINFLLNVTFPDKKYQVGKILDFPIGNMFWSRVSAIYQIFELDISNKFPIERRQTDSTIMHAIERFWLFLVKINGYYYKKNFKSY